jgi:hypothetical protein
MKLRMPSACAAAAKDACAPACNIKVGCGVRETRTASAATRANDR